MPLISGVSIRDLADRLGLGKSTVARALNGDARVAGETRERILRTAQEIGYRGLPSLRLAMHELRAGSGERKLSPLVWLRSGLGGEVREEAAFETACRVAERFGYELLPLSGREMVSTIQRRVRAWNARAVITLYGESLLRRMKYRLLEEPIPVVLITSSPRMQMPVPTISVRLVEVARLALHETFTSGYRRIGVTLNSSFHDPELEFTGAWYANWEHLELGERVPFFELGRKGLRVDDFREWVERYRIDCVCSFSSSVEGYFERIPYRVPEELGYVHLMRSLHVGDPEAATVDDCVETMAEVAVSRAIHLAERSVGWEFEVAGRVFVEPRWRPGATLRQTEAANRVRSVDFPEAKVLSERVWRPVSLARVVNRPMTGTGGWFPGERLDYFSPGHYRLAGVRFEVAEDPETRVARFIMLPEGGLKSREGGAVEVGIGASFKELYLLYASAYIVGLQRPFGRYEIQYRNGSQEVIPIQAGPNLRLGEDDREANPAWNVHDWWRGASTIENAATKPVWISLSGETFIEVAHLYVHRWVNPHPRKRVERVVIRVERDQSGMLGVIGMTIR